VVRLPVPVPSEGQVLIKIEASGICHSDCEAHTPKSAEALQPVRPLVGGHEGVGRIVALGPGLSESGTSKVGDRVGIPFLARCCGRCDACKQGKENFCRMLDGLQFSGFTLQGTFQEYALGYADWVIPIPDSIPSEQACPILCAGVTVYNALRAAKPKAGQWVAIPGAGGGLGHLAVQYGQDIRRT